MPAIGMMKAQPNRMVVVSASTDDYNLKTAAGNPAYQATVICKVNSAVEIGSTSTSTPGWQTGTSWAKGIKLRIVNEGTIVGRGGDGGDAVTATYGNVGELGGDAIKLDQDLKIDNTGIIGGGGGGGAAGGYPSITYNAGGGGGAGKQPGLAGTDVASGYPPYILPADGTLTDGGTSGHTPGYIAAGGTVGNDGQDALGTGIGSTNAGGGGGLGGKGGRGAANTTWYPDGGVAGRAINLNSLSLIWQRTGNRYGTYT